MVTVSIYFLSLITFFTSFLIIFNAKLKRHVKDVLILIALAIFLINEFVFKSFDNNVYYVVFTANLYAIYTIIYRQFFKTGITIFRFNKDLMLYFVVFLLVLSFSLINMLQDSTENIVKFVIFLFQVFSIALVINGFIMICINYPHSLGVLANINLFLLVLAFVCVIITYFFNHDFAAVYKQTEGKQSILNYISSNFTSVSYFIISALVFLRTFRNQNEINSQLIELNASKENEFKIIDIIQNLVIHSEEFESTIENMLRIAIDLTNSDGAVLYMYDKESDDFYAKKIEGYVIPPFQVNNKVLEDKEMLEKKFEVTRLDQKDIFIKAILERDEAIVIKRDPTDESRKVLRHLRDYATNIDSMQAGKILVEGELFGILILGKLYSDYSEVDSNVFAAIGSFSGVLIKNIQSKALEKESERLSNEMKIAEKIQTSILPRKYDIDGYTISAFMKPAEEVGGDYYDVIKSPDGSYWANIGDVTGHGVTAGLIMLMLQTSSSTIIHSIPDISPDQLAVHCNNIIYNNVQNRLLLDQFITTCFLKFNDEGIFQYAGAHEDILIYRYATRNVEVLKTSGIWLGLMDDISHGTTTNDFNLYKGDVLLIYTDGVIEIQNNTGEQYDVKRLIEFLKHNGGKAPDDISKELMYQLTNFKDEQKDDITFMVIKRD